MARVKKPTVKSVTEQFQQWRIATKDYIFKLSYPDNQKIATIPAADAQGKLNGLTVVELLTMVNMSQIRGERIVLRAGINKTLEVYAEQATNFPPPVTI